MTRWIGWQNRHEWVTSIKTVFVPLPPCLQATVTKAVSNGEMRCRSLNASYLSLTPMISASAAIGSHIAVVDTSLIERERDSWHCTAGRGLYKKDCSRQERSIMVKQESTGSVDTRTLYPSPLISVCKIPKIRLLQVT
jgi:hypothetical protein